MPPQIAARVVVVDTLDDVADLRAVLFDGDARDLRALDRRIAAREGPIVQIQTAMGDEYDLDRLLEETSISTNTAAAGGNASLMSIE